MSFICQATVSDGKWSAHDIGAPWCDEKAVTTVRVTLIPMRHGVDDCDANVWVCQKHYDEFLSAMEAA